METEKYYGLYEPDKTTNAYIKNTALTICIYTTQSTEVNGDFKITYDGNFLCNVKKIEKDN